MEYLKLSDCCWCRQLCPKNMLTIASLITLFALVNPGESNPLPVPTPDAQGQHRSPRDSAALVYESNPNSRLVSGAPNATTTSRLLSFPLPSAVSSAQLSEEPLVKPSDLTFKVNRFCQADVSLERIICNNLRKRGDLPPKEKYFDKMQQGVFVNISGGGDLRLEDFRSLFPNLIVLSITQSPYTTASLINLQGTRASGQWESQASLAPKSLLANPIFARRLNMNQQHNMFQTLTAKPSSANVIPGNRGGRALANSDNLSDDTTSGLGNLSVTTTTTSSSVITDQRQDEENRVKVEPEETNEIPLSDFPQDGEPAVDTGKGKSRSNENTRKEEPLPPFPERLRRLVWPTVRHLNLSWNELTSDALPDFLGNIFPNLEKLDLSNNFLSKLDKIRDANWTRMSSIDISGNPLDCTNLNWIEGLSIKLLQPNRTLCDQPPHQNKAKPIFKVLPLLKKVREECRGNCSCDIAYIWEQNHVVHSKTVVNCSGRGFHDFPPSDFLPRPTDTLDLRNNSISSMSTFVDNQTYLDLNVTNLYMDDNQISSINILEGSEWFYHFQVFSIRRNNLTEVPVYVLENVFRQNKRLLQIDLSSNKFKCDCSTVSSFKVWLLKYSDNIGHIDDVRCASTNEQIRYMRLEEWCKIDNGTQLLDVLDMLSIVLAILIVVVIAKVYYDYWNFKHKGKLPWIVSKM